MTCKSEIYRLLCGHPLFAASDDGTRQLLAGQGTARSYSSGQPMLHKGSEAASVFVLVSGAVRVFHRSEDGSELLLKLFRAPALFGEIEALSDVVYREHAAAATRAQVVCIPRAAFLQALARDVVLANAVLTDVGRRFCITVDHERVLSFENVRAHIAYALVSRVTTKQRQTAAVVAPIVEVTQEELAREIGVTRRAVVKQMSRLRSEQLIARHGRQWLILDFGRLREAAKAFELSLVYSCSAPIALHDQGT